MSEETLVTVEPASGDEIAVAQPEAPPAVVVDESTPSPSEASSGTDEAAAEQPAAGNGGKPAVASSPPRRVEPEPVRLLRQAMDSGEPVKGKVIGWNNGGFHVVVDGMTAFCPRSEMEIEASKAPKTYLDRDLVFRVLKIQRSGKRVVLSRSAHLRGERHLAREKLKSELEAGGVRKGRVASITDFGAFVDLDGLQGLVHISELSRRRVEHPSEVVEVGQEVEVKILRIEGKGKRISLSMKALEPDPWEGVEKRFEEGTVVSGTVERTANFGAFITLEPGLTGLLPTSVMGLPRDAAPARIFPPGKEVSVQVQSVDRRRRRISLTLEGSQVEGSRKDFDSFKREQSKAGSGFNALAAALEKARGGGD